ncbi:GNAT family N-acetyltransferase [Sediminicurvatus halobius]|uniref:GNAT family N-acetyltransferase n=1 Tax=Sediminicurvatus halobius TaxID=2182432 RepID=A0A2U2MWL8_9GAMM|nr:GNAT family N-acetyltransferase [Spiribacter halobius]PWG61234.1 GNAT family N-acetyltransferase [Spiribacter halobius]UEX79206.1 GNAT family N-acetyltransferase [Spiribacter halobius]
MTESYQVRRAATADAAEIARLSVELGYAASTGEIAARLVALLPERRQYVAVAAGHDALLGWVAAERRLLLESGETVEIVGLVVCSSTRRSGVGRALVASAEHWASSQGIGTVTVRSNAARGESHAFYESIGYARQKTQHVYVKSVRA